MAVVANQLNSRLQLKLNTGNDENGNPIIKTKGLSNVKPGADNEDAMAIAVAVSQLQKHELSSVIRVNEEELIES